MALPSRPARPFAALAAGFALAMLAACGMNVQTNQSYTPAQGVNFDVGAVHVRNLLVLSRTTGEGILSASLLTSGDDTLTKVSGDVIGVDGKPSGAIAATLPAPIAFGGGSLLVLTNQKPLVTLTGSGLQAGLEAQLVLTFGKAGTATVRVPIASANQPEFATVGASAPAE